MAKKQGIEAAAERLRAVLAQAEEAMRALTERVESDEEPPDVARDELGKLHAEASALVTRAEALLERAREAVNGAEERANQAVENGAEFVSAFEELVAGLESAAETLDPASWEWSDQGDQG